MAKKALFLDRDGVINKDYGYVHTVDTFHFLDGIFDLARLASEKGYLICVVTNQAGIGRGYYSESQFLMLTSWMCERFKEEGATISKVYYSPFHPTHGIGRYKKDDFSRKPNPGMLLNAISYFDLDPQLCILIGDAETDIHAGLAADIGTNIYLGSNNITIADCSKQIFSFPSLEEVIRFLWSYRL